MTMDDLVFQEPQSIFRALAFFLFVHSLFSTLVGLYLFISCLLSSLQLSFMPLFVSLARAVDRANSADTTLHHCQREMPSSKVLIRTFFFIFFLLFHHESYVIRLHTILIVTLLHSTLCFLPSRISPISSFTRFSIYSWLNSIPTSM